MCTQVGVGGVIVGYAILGAFTFIALETDGNPTGDDDFNKLIQTRVQVVENLFQNYSSFGWTTESEWEGVANQTLIKFQVKDLNGSYSYFIFYLKFRH